jgi:GT2 family glycosyltransferase/lipopolysaccharide/colanic/teichoic acid biosynthesis glycosyltransferase
MDLTIVIVNYNVKEFLEQSIISIKKSCRNIEYELVVVDNASSDGSIELIRQNFPEIKLITNTENKGFAAANNQAIKRAQGEFILLINPDTIVQEDTFSVILNFFKNHPECGMVGCKILNPDGSLQLACRRSFPTPWVAFTKIIGLSKLFPNSKLFGRYNLTYLDPDRTYEVEAISGSFMFFRRQVVENIGYLDDSFFMYGEDLDWCFRIREAGWKIYYLPETKIIHFKGESSKKTDIDLILQFYRAMKLFVEKHYHHRYLHVPQWLLMLGITLRASLTFLSKFLSWVFPGLLDYGLLNLSMLLAIYIRFQSLTPHLRSYLIVMVVYSLIWLLSLILVGSYGKSKYSSLRTTYGVLVGLTLNTSLTFFFNQYAFSRAVVLISGALNILLLGGWRFGLKILSRFRVFPFKGVIGKTLIGRRALIVAPADSGRRIAAKLKNRLDTGYEVCGIVFPDEHTSDDKYQEVPILGNLKYLDEIVRQTRAQEIIFSTEQISYDKVLEIIAHTKKEGVTFKLIPSSMDVIIGKASIEYIGDLPLMDIDYKLNHPVNIYIKRIFDVIISFLALVIFAPEIFFLKFIKKIKLKKKKIYTINSKQRTISEFSDDNLSSRQRKLPYLWSVLTGKLSIIGSEIIEVNDHEQPKGCVELKPGLTGLFQINKHNAFTSADCERYNLYYLKNYSLLLDIEIIIKAIFKI